MTRTIPNVPRKLLERVLNAGWGSETVNALDDLRDFLESASSSANHVEDVRAMVAAPSPAGVDGLEVAGLSERIRPGVEAAPWVCDEVKKLETIIDGIRAENETLRNRAKTAEREAESALKTYKGLEKVARVVSDNSDQVCGELNVMRQERDRLAQRIGDMEQILRDLMPGCKGPLMRQRIDAALAGKAAQA